MDELLTRRVDEIARTTGFSGAVRVDEASGVRVARAYGLADRRHGVANTLATRFGIASGVKGITAVAVVSLVESRVLAFDTRARDLLGEDLPLIDDRVTIEHLLAHRSGIGDYLDESGGTDVNDHVMPVPVHRLAATEQYLDVLDGHPQMFAPGERFQYCNGGYVVLALLAERAGGTEFHELVSRRVVEPAGMSATAFLRSDELPGDAAVGYLDGEGLRSNVLHLPVRGSGDGGIFSTVADLRSFWIGLFSGALISTEIVEALTHPVSEGASSGLHYGLGFWLSAHGPDVVLEGYDAGVSFRSAHDPTTGRTWTVVSNTSRGAWPVVERLEALL